MNKAEIYLKRQTAHRVISVIGGDLDNIIKSANSDAVMVEVDKLEAMKQAVDNALMSLIGT